MMTTAATAATAAADAATTTAATAAAVAAYWAALRAQGGRDATGREVGGLAWEGQPSR